MALQRRGFIWSSGALLVGERAGAQEAYPDREVRIVLPFGTGGEPQYLARLLAQGLMRALGQPFLVQNRAGDGGMVGTCVAGVSRPDGHTLLLTADSVHALALNLQPCVFNVAAGFVPISHLASTSLLLCVPADSRFSTTADLVAAAQAAPGGIRYGSLLQRSMPVLALAQAFDISLTGVTTPSSTAIVDLLMRGRVEFAFLGLGNALSHVRAGHLRALAVTTPARLPEWPDLPTLAEQGMPAFQLTVDFGLLAPSGTPEPILARLSEATIAVMRRGLTRELLAPLGYDVVASTRAEAAAHMESQAHLWATMLRTFGGGVQP